MPEDERIEMKEETTDAKRGDGACCLRLKRLSRVAAYFSVKRRKQRC
jgi:hypothetical protein